MNLNKKAIESYSTQSINAQDEKSVLDALRSDFLSRGPKIDLFEKKLGKICNNKNVLSVNSATSALQLAYQVHGIDNNSVLWTSPITFVATSNAALQLGAKIDFVDIDPDTLNICPKKLEKKLSHVAGTHDSPGFLTVVHFGGNPCDMKEIFKLSKKYKFKVIEDASHALGAFYNGYPIGDQRYSCASVFSFHPVKMITTGEGGALLLDSIGKLENARQLCSHGIVREKFMKDGMPEWYYEQIELGYNFRMSELQAALGLSQITRLRQFVKKRNRLAKIYQENLDKYPLKYQRVTPNDLSSYHLFIVRITNKAFKRDDLYRFLKQKKIGCQVHYIPVHLHPYYKKLGFCAGMFPEAEKYYESCLSLPLHQNLKELELEYICDALKEFFKC